MIDLKLLVDVVWANRDGSTDFFLEKGEFAAADRLWRKKLILRVGTRVQPSIAGETLVAKFVDEVEKRR